MQVGGGTGAAYLLSAGLSLAGSTGVLAVSCRSRSRHIMEHHMQLRMLVQLAVADGFAAMAHFIPTWYFHQQAPAGLCTAQAIMQQFFFLASFLWIASIAVNQYCIRVRRERFPQKFEVYYRIVAWGIPMVTVGVMLGMNAEGLTDGGALWCWITPQFQVLRWTLFYAPLVLVMALIVVLYAKIWRELDQSGKGVIRNARLAQVSYTNLDQGDEETVERDRGARVKFNMSSFLIVFLIIRFPSILNRFYELVNQASSPYWILLLHAICSPLQGFVNSVVFWKSDFVNHYLLSQRKASSMTKMSNGLGVLNRFANPNHNLRTSGHIISRFKVVVMTWNRGNSPFNRVEFQKFIMNSDLESVHLFVIGFQECLDPKCFQEITSLLPAFLSFVTSEQMGAIKVGLWKSNEIVVEHVKSSKEATGVANVLENKGGVALGVTLSKFSDNSTLSLCFICAHLAAHLNFLADRNDDIYQLFARLSFQSNDQDVTSQFDSVVFFGDLNYRIEGDVEEIIKSVKLSEWDELIERDQLTKSKSDNVVLTGFFEGRISFPPTFKVIPNMHELQYSAKREPSWCDRILFKTRDYACIDQLKYSSSTDLISSDHRAVIASLLIGHYADVYYADTNKILTCVFDIEQLEACMFMKSISEDFVYPAELYMQLQSSSSLIERNIYESDYVEMSHEIIGLYRIGEISGIEISGSLSDFKKLCFNFILKDEKLIESNDFVGSSSLDIYRFSTFLESSFSEMDEKSDTEDGRPDQKFESFEIPICKFTRCVGVLTGLVRVRSIY
jgi:hypothetical protein